MRPSQPIAFLAVLALALLAGCSSDDKTTNPDGGGGGGGSAGVNLFGAQIAGLTAQYVAANAEAYASLDVMGPFIAASLGSPAPPVAARAFEPALTCFSGVAGTTYIFNGTTYEAGPAAGAPDNGVRYVLYRLNASNEPILSDSIGFVEVRCTLVNTASKSVGMTLVANGVTPVSVDGTVSEVAGGGNFNVSGYLAAAGAPTLSLQLYGDYGADARSFQSVYSTSDLQVQMASTDSAATGNRHVSLFAFYNPEPNFTVTLLLRAPVATEAVEGGALYYGDVTTSGIDQLVACASGGTLAQPTFSAPDAACNQLGYDIGPAMSATDLATVTSGYGHVRSIHDVLTELAIHAFGIPTGFPA